MNGIIQSSIYNEKLKYKSGKLVQKLKKAMKNIND